MPKTILIALVLLAGGCANNGLLDIEAGDCEITILDADIEGRFTQTNAEGRVYIRRGTCDAQDRAVYERAR